MAEEARPFTAASFRCFLNERKLMGSRCTECGTVSLPPHAICPRCHANAPIWVPMPLSGRLTAFTSIFVGPPMMLAAGYDRSHPYCSGIVEVADGVCISARLVGVNAALPAEIRIGSLLQADFLEQGEGKDKTAILAFRP